MTISQISSGAAHVVGREVTSTNAATRLSDAIKKNAAERIDKIQSGAAPEGVDPDIWSVLTKQEKIFFARTGGLGILTYANSSSGAGVSAMPIVRGARLDIRI